MKYILILLLLFITLKVQSQVVDTLRVHFPFDKYHLTEIEKNKLDQVLSTLADNPIQLMGHCDAIGSNEYNDRLSEQRVQTVADYLVANGIPLSTIKLKEGYGEEIPIAANLTEEGRQMNRRVDIVWQVMIDTAEEVTEISDHVIDTTSDVLKEQIEEVEEGGTIRLKNINFYGGRHTFLPQSIPALEALLQVMKDNPTLVIDIQGHICCRIGNPEDGEDYDANDKHLSRNRARAVYDYLVSNGISKDRMTYRGFAGTMPLVNPEMTSADRTLNRRVEIKIVRK